MEDIRDSTEVTMEDDFDITEDKPQLFMSTICHFLEMNQDTTTL